MHNNRILLTYIHVDELSGESYPGYAVLDVNGSTKFGPALMASGGVKGRALSVVQLGSGPILMAWTQTEDNQIAFAIVDQGTYGLISGPTVLVTPDGRPGDYASIIYVGKGRGILTWVDADLGQALYYALVHQNGTVISAPMAFYQTGSDDVIIINEAGKGNAPYLSKRRLFMPISLRGNP
jgi:hypothetical protein